MDHLPENPANRPDELHNSSISTPLIEADASEMRRTHLGIIISDPRLNISTGSIAKVLQQQLGLDWEDITVSAAYPDDFIVRFKHPWQRDVALELGSAPLRHGTMALTSWLPTARGRPKTWRYYCRVVIENLPLNAWDDLATVKAVLGGACELDRVERRTATKDNKAAMFVWV